MLGAFFGDIAGSIYEFRNIKTTDFDLYNPEAYFTDDSVMTAAVAKTLVQGKGLSDEELKRSLVRQMRSFGRRYPHRGYGGHFLEWIYSDTMKAYNSYGNGSAMRVSAAGWLYDTLAETEHYAQLTAVVTHNHPEGIKGARAAAAAIYMARNRSSKEEISAYITKTYGYDLSFTLDEIRPVYTFDVSCQGSVPQAIRAFLEGDSFEEVIRLAVSIGGDSDTIACIAGSIAEAYYGMTGEQKRYVLEHIPEEFAEIAETV